MSYRDHRDAKIEQLEAEVAELRQKRGEESSHVEWMRSEIRLLSNKQLAPKVNGLAVAMVIFFASLLVAAAWRCGMAMDDLAVTRDLWTQDVAERQRQLEETEHEVASCNRRLNHADVHSTAWEADQAAIREWRRTHWGSQATNSRYWR